VKSSMTAPGDTRATGATPPKVQANSWGSGRYSKIEKSLIKMEYAP
jgi:hypothetical protein